MNVRFRDLINSFPVWRGVGGVPQDLSMNLLRVLCTQGLSHGEACSARFLLGVWNPATDWTEIAREEGFPNPEAAQRFDLHEAMGVWDEHYRGAFIQWCLSPWWP